MKIKSLAIGAILIAIVMMLVPSTSAVESNTIKTTNKAQLLDQLRHMTPQEITILITEKLKTNTGSDGLLTALLVFSIPVLIALFSIMWILLFLII